MNLKNMKTLHNVLFQSIYILNFLILGLIITFTIYFYINIEIFILSNLIIIISILTLLMKLLYWYSIKQSNIDKSNFNYKKISLSKLAICIFIYITPAYYMTQWDNLVISNNLISITLVIIIFIVIIGMFIEKHLTSIEQ